MNDAYAKLIELQNDKDLIKAFKCFVSQSTDDNCFIDRENERLAATNPDSKRYYCGGLEKIGEPIYSQPCPYYQEKYDLEYGNNAYNCEWLYGIAEIIEIQAYILTSLQAELQKNTPVKCCECKHLSIEKYGKPVCWFTGFPILDIKTDFCSRAERKGGNSG